MTRKPKISPPSVELRTDPNVIQQIRHYRLITPLYGGGVEPNQADPISVVRGSEVRGHLRFWWRATQLRRFSSLDNLLDEESKIWGSSVNTSRVQVLIHDSTYDPNTSEPAYKVIKNREGKNRVESSNHIAPYVTFPLQPDKDQRRVFGWESDKLLMDVKFSLLFKFPINHQPEIEQSLWAWENFGGIGARTRRGFGSLVCTEIDGMEKKLPKISDLGADIHNFLSILDMSNPAIPGVPFLSPNSQHRLLIDSSSSIEQWKKLIKKYQDFRQSRYTFRGRSQWPAPDTIRNETGDYERHHRPTHRVQGKIPRAQFGLPIIFKFSPNAPNDPKSTTLQGKGGIDRMSSPLILRPIECDEGAAAALALVLNWENIGEEQYTPPFGLELIGYPDPIDIYSNLEPSEALKINPLNGEVNPLLAFLNYL